MQNIAAVDELTDIEMYRNIDVDVNEYRVGDSFDGPENAFGLNRGRNPYRIEKLVRLIEENAELNLKWRIDENGKKIVDVEEYLGNKNNFYIQRQKGYRLSERVELFQDCFDRSGLISGFDISPHEFSYLSREIKKELKSESFKDRVRRRKLKSDRNQKEAVRYVRALFEKHSRLLVLRVDFSYKSNIAKGISIAQVRKDFKKLINSKRFNRIFSSLKGYIWKLECGEEKGLHFHFILFFDGSRVHKDAYLAMQIGEYWKENVTAGRGIYFNCNNCKNKYKKLGIGMIDYNDVELRDNLENLAIRYLTKKDQYLVRENDGVRTFGKGIMPLASSEGRGRPRTRGIVRHKRIDNYSLV